MTAHVAMTSDAAKTLARFERLNMTLPDWAKPAAFVGDQPILHAITTAGIPVA